VHGVTSSDLLADAFGRIRGIVHDVVDGLTPDQLAFRADDRANSIAWLVWHLTRIQDDHVSDVAGLPQVWIESGWADRLGLPFDVADHGYGHRPEDVAAVHVSSGQLLTGYHDAVCEQTLGYVRTITDEDLPRVVDRRWDPPVTLGVRLVSVIADDLQHAGQAAFVRGLVERAS
jgi:hypothetical protein